MEEIKKEVAPEVSVQEQYTVLCNHCNKINEIVLPSGTKPSYCMHCGSIIQYTKNQFQDD